VKCLYSLSLMLCCLYGFSNPYLKKFDAYQQKSYYEHQVYQEHTFQTFYQLDAIRATVSADAPDLHLLNACLFFATNKLRAMKQKPLLQYDARLKDAAAMHSYQMATRHFFEHNNYYESKIKTPENRLHYVGIKYSMYAENCSKEYLDDDEISYIELAQQIIEGLYNSPPHRTNLMMSALKYCALSAAIEKDKKDIYVVVTQNFYK
jgi:uncharacterized protein YkwD